MNPQSDATEQFGPVAERYLTSAWHANEAALAHCVEVAKPRGGPVLDVGTGAGHTAFAFAGVAERVVALDPTGEMLQVVEAEAVKRGLTNIETRRGYAEALPYSDGSFEGVTCRVAAHHFRDVRAFLSETARVLKPGGWFLLVDTVGIDDPIADEALDKIEWMRDSSHVRDYKVADWLRMVAENRMTAISHEVNHKPLNAHDWLDRMRVEEPTRSKVIEAIVHSTGWLREYLRPHGEADDLTFHLAEVTLLCRK